MHVTDLCAIIAEMDNSFSDNSGDHLVLDYRDIADELVIATMRNIERVGQEQYSLFVAEGLEERSKSKTDPIKQIKFLIISSPSVKQI